MNCHFVNDLRALVPHWRSEHVSILQANCAHRQEMLGLQCDQLFFTFLLLLLLIYNLLPHQFNYVHQALSKRVSVRIPAISLIVEMGFHFEKLLERFLRML
jgi:hypothetical protein